MSHFFFKRFALPWKSWFIEMNRYISSLILRCCKFIIWIILFSDSCVNATDNNFKLSKFSSRSPPKAPKTHVYNFNVTIINAAPDGVFRRVWTINEQFPGPTIEITKGDRLIMNVYNNLDEITGIHAHGIFQNGTPWYDGAVASTQCGIPPKQSFTYNFTVNQVGTYW